MEEQNRFHAHLKQLIHEYVRLVYKITREFPKDELYGMTSQLRRSALSVMLNYIEGFARRRPAVMLNFMEISYGSLKESKYLVYLAHEEKYMETNDYKTAIKLAEEIGAMLWRTLEKIGK